MIRARITLASSWEQELKLGKILSLKFQQILFKVKILHKKFIELNPTQNPHFLSKKKKKKKPRFD